MWLATALTWAYLVVLVNMPGPAAGAEYWQQPVTFVTEAGSNFDENSQLLPADNPGVPLSRCGGRSPLLLATPEDPSHSDLPARTMARNPSPCPPQATRQAAETHMRSH